MLGEERMRSAALWLGFSGSVDLGSELPVPPSGKTDSPKGGPLVGRRECSGFISKRLLFPSHYWNCRDFPLIFTESLEGLLECAPHSSKSATLEILSLKTVHTQPLATGQFSTKCSYQAACKLWFTIVILFSPVSVVFGLQFALWP